MVDAGRTINTRIPAIQQGTKHHRAQVLLQTFWSLHGSCSFHPPYRILIHSGWEKKIELPQACTLDRKLYTAHMQTQYPDRHVWLTRRSFFVFLA